MTSAWSSIKARRRWTVWMEFFGSEFAVAVFIEILQGLPRIVARVQVLRVIAVLQPASFTP